MLYTMTYDDDDDDTLMTVTRIAFPVSSNYSEQHATLNTKDISRSPNYFVLPKQNQSVGDISDLHFMSHG